MTRRLVVAVCVIGSVCLAAPAAALAGTASSDGMTITFTANAGEENSVVITPGGSGGCAALAGEWCVTDFFQPTITPAGSCVAGSTANQAECPGSRFVADLGDMDDVGQVG